MGHEERVAAYYDRNTSRFLRWGKTARTNAIHRCVWGPGVTNRQEAAHFVDGRVLGKIEAMDSSSDPVVLDLGCGVGAGLVHLAKALPAARLLGVTLSPAQAEQARAIMAQYAGRHQVEIRCASFLDLPELGSVDLAYAIESFVHARDPTLFFRSVAKAVRPGGLLVLCDDVLVDRALTPRETDYLTTFQRGWLAPSVLPLSRLVERAGLEGFSLQEDQDMTPWVESGRPRDWMIRIGVAGVGWLMELGSYGRALKGGDALQALSRSGALTYRVLTFVRQA